MRATIGRGLKLLSRLASKDQAQRIGCVLRKLLQTGADDRWVFPELVATVAETAVLKALPKRISYPDIPVPFAPEMEHAVLPSAEKIVAAVKQILRSK